MVCLQEEADHNTRVTSTCIQQMYQPKEKWNKCKKSSLVQHIFSSFIVLTSSFVHYHNFSLGDKKPAMWFSALYQCALKFTAMASDKL